MLFRSLAAQPGAASELLLHSASHLQPPLWPALELCPHPLPGHSPGHPPLPLKRQQEGWNEQIWSPRIQVQIPAELHSLWQKQPSLSLTFLVLKLENRNIQCSYMRQIFIDSLLYAVGGRLAGQWRCKVGGAEIGRASCRERVSSPV